MDLKEFFLKQKQATHQGTLGVLAKIPKDQLGWRPAEGMLSLGEIVRHIWMSEEGVRRVALEGDWGYYVKRVPQGLFAILGQVTSLDDELAKLERVHQETLAAVRAFPLERWEEERSNPEFNIRRKVSVMLFGITEHQIHHRAQVGAYLHILLGQRASPYVL
ncbi:MAG TPA: DinB family protein [Terriglobia bacterium]|nr:DinB family protein [Terriglobia bacterium]